MAITTQVFNQGNTAAAAAALASALETTALFDSVTVSGSGTSTAITCTKGTQNILTIYPCISTAEQEFMRIQNSQGDFPDTSVTWNSGYPDGYCSISTIGKVLFCIFSTSISITSGMVYLVLCVDSTDSGNIGIYYYRHDVNSGTVNGKYRTFCSESLQLDTSYAVTAPLSSGRNNICTYPVTAQNRNGSCDAFKHTFGIRYSPPLHTNAASQVGVTPAKLKIGSKNFLTDGTIIIEDAGGAE